MRKTAFTIALALLAIPSARASDAAQPGDPAQSVMPHPADEAALKKLTVQEVSAKLSSGEKVYIFDNNPPELYAQKHVPGAVWVNSREVKASDLPTDKGAQLVFYCAGERCRACHKAAATAMELGYTNVFIMPAGLFGWEKAGMKMEAGAAKGEAAATSTS